MMSISPKVLIDFFSRCLNMQFSVFLGGTEKNQYFSSIQLNHDGQEVPESGVSPDIAP